MLMSPQSVLRFADNPVGDCLHDEEVGTVEVTIETQQ